MVILGMERGRCRRKNVMRMRNGIALWTTEVAMRLKLPMKTSSMKKNDSSKTACDSFAISEDEMTNAVEPKAMNDNCEENAKSA